MSFDLLRSLYGGKGTNADLVRNEDLSRLHIETPLEAFVPKQVAGGYDVVLTGNPGDGKSHVVRLLQARNSIPSAVVETDLSARDTASVAATWAGAVAAGKPFVLCGNEGPLLDLLEHASKIPALAPRTAELRQQVGRLTVARRADLPSAPERALLIDLADRNLVSEEVIERALERVCDYSFLPSQLGMKASQTSAGRNILLLAGAATSRKRLAKLLAIAGRRRGGHFTFRQLWQAISFSIIGGKSPNTLLQEHYQGKVGLGTFPLDYLVKENGHGALIEAVRAFADPAAVSDPDLDERLWTGGVGGLGTPDKEAPLDVPSLVWDQGDREGALAIHAQLKRYVALIHPAGDALLERLANFGVFPSQKSDDALLAAALEGLRRLYTPPESDEQAPDWLLSGLPLWIGHSYADISAAARPHVAVGSRPPDEFMILRPQRAPWLGDVLGPLPEEAWLAHQPSGALLRLDPDILHELERAANTVGPLPLPDGATRFLARIAGWEEASPTERVGMTRFAVLARPRGGLIVHGAVVNGAEGARYA